MNVWRRIDELEHQARDLKDKINDLERLVRGFTTPEGRTYPGMSEYFWGLVTALGYKYEQAEPPPRGKFTKKSDSA